MARLANHTLCLHPLYVCILLCGMSMELCITYVVVRCELSHVYKVCINV